MKRFRSRVSLLILSHPKPFVKNFFQVFSNFFVCFSCLCRSKQLCYLSTFDSVCQELFSSFSNFFVWLNLLLLDATGSSYHKQFDLSRTFFKLFSNLFVCFRFVPSPAGNSHILAPTPPFVKYFFHLFYFHFSDPLDGASDYGLACFSGVF